MREEVTGVVELLATEAVDGVGVTEVSRRLGLSKPKAHRVLRVLVEAGWAEKTSSDKYVISAHFGQLADSVRRGYLAKADMIQRRLAQMETPVGSPSA